MKFYLVLLMIIIVKLLLCEAGAMNDHVTKLDRQYKQKKAECEQTVCHITQYNVDEIQNCINKCISESCFQSIYAAEPLEDGEIDMARLKQFTLCARRDLKVDRLKKME